MLVVAWLTNVCTPSIFKLRAMIKSSWSFDGMSRIIYESASYHINTQVVIVIPSGTNTIMRALV